MCLYKGIQSVLCWITCNRYSLLSFLLQFQAKKKLDHSLLKYCPNAHNYSCLNLFPSCYTSLTFIFHPMQSPLSLPPSLYKDYILECGICYTHRHYETGRAPDFTCDNKQCSQPYHLSCLHEVCLCVHDTAKR